MFLVLLLSVVAVYAEGISNAKELAAFAKAVNKGEDISKWRNEKGHIYLDSDIDMAKMKKWTPIKEFKGTFDGKGHALLNWKTKQGLFELITENSTVQNLRIDSSCSMTVSTIDDINLISSFFKRNNITKVDALTRSHPDHSLAAETVYNVVSAFDIIPRSLNRGMAIVKVKSDFEILLAIVEVRGRIHFRNCGIHLLGQGDSSHVNSFFLSVMYIL